MPVINAQGIKVRTKAEWWCAFFLTAFWIGLLIGFLVAINYQSSRVEQAERRARQEGFQMGWRAAKGELVQVKKTKR